MFNRNATLSFAHFKQVASISLAFWATNSIAFAQSTQRPASASEEWSSPQPVQLRIPSNTNPPPNKTATVTGDNPQTTNSVTRQTTRANNNVNSGSDIADAPMREPTARMISSNDRVSDADRATAERSLRELALNYMRQNPSEFPKRDDNSNLTRTNPQNRRPVQPASFVSSQPLAPGVSSPAISNQSSFAPSTSVSLAPPNGIPAASYAIGTPCGPIGFNEGFISDVRVVSDVPVGLPTNQPISPRRDGMVDLTATPTNAPAAIRPPGYTVGNQTPAVLAPSLGEPLSNATPSNVAIRSSDLGWQTPPPRVGRFDREASQTPRLAAVTSNGSIDPSGNTRPAIATTPAQPLKPATNSGSPNPAALGLGVDRMQPPPAINPNNRVPQRDVNSQGTTPTNTVPLGSPPSQLKLPSGSGSRPSTAAPVNGAGLSLPKLPNGATQIQTPPGQPTQGQRLSGRPFLSGTRTANILATGDPEADSMPFLDSRQRDFTSITNPDPRTLLAQNTTPGGLAMPPDIATPTSPGAGTNPTSVLPPSPNSASVLPQNNPAAPTQQEQIGQGTFNSSSPSDLINRPASNIPNPSDPANLPRYRQAPQVVTGAPFVTAGPEPRDAFQMVTPASFFAGGQNGCGVIPRFQSNGLPPTQPLATQPAASPFGLTPPTVLPGQIPGLYSQNNSGLRPLFTLGQENYNVSLGRGIIGQPVAYVNGQYFRNFLRYLSP